MYDEDSYLLISGIQHFVYCRRQWALIHVEALWADNFKTVGGEMMHDRVHNSFSAEKRGDMLTVRGMPVFSRTFGIQGVCDVVEFRRDDSGVTLFGREGRWLPVPVEYKVGKPKLHDADRLQLCAQAVCLEEMLLCPTIETAFLYYGEPKKRESVTLDAELRKKLADILVEMRDYHERKHTPRAKVLKGCAVCSMRDVCLPRLPPKGSVAEYIDAAVREEAP